MKKAFQISLTATLVIILWEGVIRIFRIPAYLLPKPQQIILAIQINFDSLLANSLVTLGEILAGFFLGFCTAILISSWSKFSKYADNAIRPFLIILQMVPVTAFGPLLLIWLGHGQLMVTIVAAAMSVFPITLNFKRGLDHADARLIDIARSIGCTKFQIFKNIQVPFSLPYLFSGLKVGMSLATIGAVVGEFIGTNKGLGYQILYSGSFLETSLMFAAIVFVVFTGVLLNLAVTWLERRIVFWKKEIFFE